MEKNYINFTIGDVNHSIELAEDRLMPPDALKLRTVSIDRGSNDRTGLHTSYPVNHREGRLQLYNYELRADFPIANEYFHYLATTRFQKIDEYLLGAYIKFKNRHVVLPSGRKLRTANLRKDAADLNSFSSEHRDIIPVRIFQYDPSFDFSGGKPYSECRIKTISLIGSMYIDRMYFTHKIAPDFQLEILPVLKATSRYAPTDDAPLTSKIDKISIPFMKFNIRDVNHSGDFALLYEGITTTILNKIPSYECIESTGYRLGDVEQLTYLLQQHGEYCHHGRSLTRESLSQEQEKQDLKYRIQMLFNKLFQHSPYLKKYVA